MLVVGSCAADGGGDCCDQEGGKRRGKHSRTCRSA
jgi:hypothetical protein